MGSDDDFTEVSLHSGIMKTSITKPDAVGTVKRPKGTCVIIHRGCEVVMESGPGKRIVSVKFDVSRSDRDPIGTAYGKLTSEFEKGGAPAIYEVDLLAKWYDPSDSTVKVRLRIPHAKYASWRENSFTSITSTRALQRIDDRLDVTFDDKLPVTAPSEQALKQVTRKSGQQQPVEKAQAVPLAAVRTTVRPDYRRQAVITLMSIAATYCFLSLGGLFVALAGVSVGFFIVHSCFFYDAFRKQALGIGTVAATPAVGVSAAPRRSEEWDVVRAAIAEHAASRADEVARAEMRIRGLLESNAPSLNPIVIESTARIANGLRDLVAAHRAPASMATPEEAAGLAGRLADSICALGVEAEDARVVAFRDAVFDFDATTRYIESRNDPILRIADDSAARRA
jgi:hypothetical protein